ncbi:MAG: hemolysin family protein [Brevinematia bacterium]
MSVSYITFPFIILFFLLSAFFSSSETALFSLDEIKIKKIKDRKEARTIKNLLKKPSILLITILLGNTIANILISSSMEKILPFKNTILITITVTLLILIFGEIIPKTIAILVPERVSKLSSLPLYFMITLLKPALKVVDRFVFRLTGLLKRKGKKSEEETNKDIIFALKSIVAREDIFNREERELIENVLMFAGKEVWNIMTPRNKIISIEKTASIDEVIQCIRKNKFSKIPVYEGTNDNITGYIEIKDILTGTLETEKGDFSIEKFIKPMYFVPETKRLSEMLADFEKKNIKIATVIDEYGSALGIVTLSDVLGEILGEIIDESFKVENKIFQLSDEKFLVSGDIGIDDFNEFFDTKIESGNFETLAGYIIERYGDIPDEGYSTKIDNLAIIVKKKKQSHIEQFLVEKG